MDTTKNLLIEKIPSKRKSFNLKENKYNIPDKMKMFLSNIDKKYESENIEYEIKKSSNKTIEIYLLFKNILIRNSKRKEIINNISSLTDLEYKINKDSTYISFKNDFNHNFKILFKPKQQGKSLSSKLTSLDEISVSIGISIFDRDKSRFAFHQEVYENLLKISKLTDNIHTILDKYIYVSDSQISDIKYLIDESKKEFIINTNQDSYLYDRCKGIINSIDNINEFKHFYNDQSKIKTPIKTNILKDIKLDNDKWNPSDVIISKNELKVNDITSNSYFKISKSNNGKFFNNNVINLSLKKMSKDKNGDFKLNAVDGKSSPKEYINKEIDKYPNCKIFLKNLNNYNSIYNSNEFNLKEFINEVNTLYNIIIKIDLINFYGNIKNLSDNLENNPSYDYIRYIGNTIYTMLLLSNLFNENGKENIKKIILRAFSLTEHSCDYLKVSPNGKEIGLELYSNNKELKDKIKIEEINLNFDSKLMDNIVYHFKGKEYNLVCRFFQGFKNYSCENKLS